MGLAIVSLFLFPTFFRCANLSLMPKVAIGLLSILLFFSVLLNLKLFSDQGSKTLVSPTVIATEIIDGDTFKISSGRRVRLLGVNAPELGKCLAEESKNQLSKLIMGKEVILSDQFSDPFGRIVANVFVENMYVNSAQVKLGLARPDYTANTHKEEIVTAYKFAREGKLGLNSEVCISVKPSTSACDIKGNVDDNTQKKWYYLKSCKFYDQVQIDLSTEDQWFCTESEAEKSGFLKAKNCD